MANKKQPAVLCPKCELNDVCRQVEQAGQHRVAGDNLGEVTPQHNLAKDANVCHEGGKFEFLYAVHEGRSRVW